MESGNARSTLQLVARNALDGRNKLPELAPLQKRLARNKHSLDSAFSTLTLSKCQGVVSLLVVWAFPFWYRIRCIRCIIKRIKRWRICAMNIRHRSMRSHNS
ncbi:hypothetical protein AX16_009774 [Volvariella volvacea WC 439]|nr:hypothetical protein AX16_009774 [Volvariella volvacea WC 439]